MQKSIFAVKYGVFVKVVIVVERLVFYQVVKKEGGKKGSELAGAADMGGIEYFTTTCETPEGDCRLLEILCQEMNAKVDPTAEETKGGSARVAKLVLSASDKQLALVAYVPKSKEGGVLSAKEWIAHVFKSFGEHGEFVGDATGAWAVRAGSVQFREKQW